MLRSGHANGPHPAPELPTTLGDQTIGIVDAVGARSRPERMDRAPRRHQFFCLRRVLRICYRRPHQPAPAPVHVLNETAVTMLATGATALAITELAAITASDTIAITAAAGVIGTLLVRHAHHLARPSSALLAAGAVSLGDTSPEIEVQSWRRGVSRVGKAHRHDLEQQHQTDLQQPTTRL